MLSFNFSNPFDLDTNLTKLIQTTSKAPGGSGPVGSYSPNRIDGALLHNDAEFYLYGGNLQRRTDASEAPDDSKVVLWRLYDYGPEKPLFRNGSDQQTFPDGVSPLVTYGAGVSAPSENKAWYIGGMRSPVWGEIYRTTSDKSNVANTTSSSLITLDMSTQLSETFSNKTLEDFKPRANPSAVWVPVGKQGILVVVGGVTYPEFASGGLAKSTNPDRSASSTSLSGFNIYADSRYRRKKVPNSHKRLIFTTLLRTSGINKRPQADLALSPEDAPSSPRQPIAPASTCTTMAATLALASVRASATPCGFCPCRRFSGSSLMMATSSTPAPATNA